jgi:Mn-dependent DtxR family transcriptional regulator
MASLPNRILRLLHERPQTMTAATITTYFASYRADYVTQTIARLHRLDLVISDDQGRMTCTNAGRVTAAMTKPARWSSRANSRSDSQPILAPNGV